MLRMKIAWWMEMNARVGEKMAKQGLHKGS
jgi:hypothetical protein